MVAESGLRAARAANAEFLEHRLGRAEASEGGLQQVRADKGGEP